MTQSATDNATKTVLVVDDDPDFLAQQEMILTAAGYRVVTAPSQAAAKALLETEAFDLAVLDLMMENQDAGFALCYQIKQSNPQMPVVIVTAVTSETGLNFDAATSEERSWIKADALLAKPIRAEQLTGLVAKLLEGVTMDPLGILVVDDEMGMRMGVARSLRDFTVSLPDGEGEVGFTVAQAATGEEAVEMVAQRTPDLMLLDYKLPGITGLDVLERIGGEGSGILTVMITAYASLETAVTATKRGAYDFLAKPFTPDELRATIRKACRHLLLQRRARQLEAERHQVRFQFISVLSHELKAPLGAIEEYLGLMRDRGAGNDPAVYDQMIDRCLVRAEGMRKMIFDLLDMTRIESGVKARNFATVDVADVIADSIETATPDADARGIAIRFAPPEPVAMAADPGELAIVFNNLISNAVKYNRDGGSVTVELTADENALTVRVTDTGIGMSDEESAKLFEDFVRIKNDKTRHITGSGLGLSTTRKLARLYRGDVTVESTPEVGSTFTVTLQRNTQPNETQDGP